MPNNMAKVDYHTLLKDIQDDIKPVLENLTKTDKWASISNWLGKLYLLKGVPFQYIVSDIRMLPQESIKFFQIDQNWLTALVDGAYSIGRTSTKDDPTLSEYLETALYQYLTPAVHKAANTLRWSQLHPKRPLSDNYSQDGLETGNNLILTGFLLRSKVLTDFKNMQVVGYDKKHIPTSTQAGDALPIVRLDHLANDLLFGIFVGQLYRLDLREPSESLHYGVDELTSTEAKVSAFTKKLRNASGAEEENARLTTPGQVFRTPPESSIYKPSGAVLNMNQLSKAMFQELSTNASTPNAVPYKNAKTDDKDHKAITTMTSADFALQMTEGSAMVSFILE